jgi:hypothetical protein
MYLLTYVGALLNGLTNDLLLYLLYLTLLYPVCCGNVPANLCGRPAERSDPGDCGLGWTFLPAPPLQVTQIRFFKLKLYLSQDRTIKICPW